MKYRPFTMWAIGALFGCMIGIYWSIDDRLKLVDRDIALVSARVQALESKR